MRDESQQDEQARLRNQRSRRTAWLVATLAGLVYLGFIIMAVSQAQ